MAERGVRPDLRGPTGWLVPCACFHGRTGVTWKLSLTGSSGVFTPWWSISATIHCLKRRSKAQGFPLWTATTGGLSFWKAAVRIPSEEIVIRRTSIASAATSPWRCSLLPATGRQMRLAIQPTATIPAARNRQNIGNFVFARFGLASSPAKTGTCRNSRRERSVGTRRVVVPEINDLQGNFGGVKRPHR